MSESNFESVKRLLTLRDYAAEVLSPVGGGKYACPVCGSGTGPNHTSAFTLYDDHWKCFSCNAGGDIFDLVGVVNHTTSKAEELELASSWIGLSVGPDVQTSAAHKQPPAPTSQHAVPAETPANTQASPRTTNLVENRQAEKAYLQQCALNLVEDSPAALYLLQRGISYAEARQLNLGFDSEAQRITIPFPGSPWYHCDRAISDETKPKYRKPSSAKVGQQPVWNSAALDAQTAFLVEGPFDAFALQTAGENAIALCGVGLGSLVQELRSRKFTGNLVVALDNDEAGRCAAQDACSKLSEAGFHAFLAQYPSWWSAESASSDAAAQRLANPEGLVSWLAEQKDAVLRDRERQDAEDASRLQERLGLFNPTSVLETLVSGQRTTELVPTGFSTLDAFLGGGLFPGLTVLGAASSLGKTTFALQMADQVALSGRTVLFATLEQGTVDLVCKSLSRLAALAGHEVSPLSMRVADQRASWSAETLEAFDAAAACYRVFIGPNIRFLEGENETRVADIAAAADLLGGDEPPVIVVDYLQMLSPADPSDTDKRAVDRNVLALRRLARALDTPVVAISSLNRASYTGLIDLSSFKESGAIEYGADLLLGIQPSGLARRLDGKNEFDSARAASRVTEDYRSSGTRQCDIIVLKNRYGRVTGAREGVKMTYIPAKNLFKERTR